MSKYIKCTPKCQNMCFGLVCIWLFQFSILWPDTYCCLEMDSFGHFFMKARTNICHNSVDPSWNEDFELDLEGSQTLRVLCYKKGPETEGDILLGRGALEVRTSLWKHCWHCFWKCNCQVPSILQMLNNSGLKCVHWCYDWFYRHLWCYTLILFTSDVAAIYIVHISGVMADEQIVAEGNISGEKCGDEWGEGQRSSVVFPLLFISSCYAF